MHACMALSSVNAGKTVQPSIGDTSAVAVLAQASFPNPDVSRYCIVVAV